MKKDLDENFPIEKGNLEDLIDSSNIHGWLNERVARSENRLAKAVSFLLKNFDLEANKKKEEKINFLKLEKIIRQERLQWKYFLL